MKSATDIFGFSNNEGKAKLLLQRFTGSKRCCVCGQPNPKSTSVEAHHIFKNADRWLIEDIVWLCGTHHDNYEEALKKTSFIYHDFGIEEQRNSFLPQDLFPDQLVCNWGSHMENSEFALAYQAMRFGSELVLRFSKDANLSLQFAISALHSLRPKLSRLADCLFFDTVIRSILPIVALSSVTNESRCELCMEIAFSLFDRESFAGFRRWANLAPNQA